MSQIFVLYLLSRIIIIIIIIIINVVILNNCEEEKRYRPYKILMQNYRFIIYVTMRKLVVDRWIRNQQTHIQY